MGSMVLGSTMILSLFLSRLPRLVPLLPPLPLEPPLLKLLP
jgi:hypothetical protein